MRHILIYKILHQYDNRGGDISIVYIQQETKRNQKYFLFWIFDSFLYGIFMNIQKQKQVDLSDFVPEFPWLLAFLDCFLPQIDTTFEHIHDIVRWS